MRQRLLAVVTPVVLLACGPASSPPAPSPGPSQPDACASGACTPATRTVKGQFRTIYRPPGGVETVAPSDPREWAGTPVAILVRDGAGYRRLPLTLGADHAFEVPGVPRGSYFLAFRGTTHASAAIPGAADPSAGTDVAQETLVEMTADEPDLSRVSTARRDHAFCVAETLIRIEVDGLAPWARGDQLRIESRTTELRQQPSVYAYPPAPGATSWNAVFPWTATRALPDASRGDVLYLSHLHTEPVTAVDDASARATWRYAARSARVEGLTLHDGQPGSITAALAPTAATSTLRFDVRGDRFAALAGAAQPGASLGSGDVSVATASLFPGRDPQLPGASLGRLILLEPAAAHQYGPLAYAHVLEGDGEDFVAAMFEYLVPSPVDDALVGNTLVAAITQFVPVSRFSGTVEPVLSPPTAPRIAGRDAFAEQSGVGTTPTLSWSPPSIGQPTSYHVKIVSGSPPAAAGELMVLSASTFATSFLVPEGFLRPGAVYRAIITARAAAGDAPDAPQFRSPLHDAAASLVTLPFSP